MKVVVQQAYLSGILKSSDGLWLSYWLSKTSKSLQITFSLLQSWSSALLAEVPAFHTLHSLLYFFGRRTDQRTASNPLTPRPRSSINSHLDWRRSVCIWPIVFLFLPDSQMLDLFPVDLRMNKDLSDQLNQTQSNASLLDAISGIVNR